MELTLDQALQKGVEAHKAGQIQEADRLYTAILKAQPKHPDANHNMGVLAVGVGKVEEALPFFKTALEANPNTAQFWLSYIDALIKLDRLPEAKAVFGQAKDYGAKGKVFKKLEQSLRNVTGKLTNQEAPEDLLDHLKSFLGMNKFQDALFGGLEALRKFPNSASLYNIIGIAYGSLNQVGEAVKCYRKAIKLKPDFFKPYNNVGVALKEQGKLEEAIEAYKKALAIKPDNAEVYYNMGNALKGIAFNKPNPSLQKTIISLLDKKSYVRPIDISGAAISLLKFEPTLKQHLQTPSDTDLEPKPLEVITDLSRLPLLLKLMSVCPLPDLALENLFRELRASLLLSISDVIGSPEVLKFQSALALQCFTNEYIYNQSEHEDEALAALEVVVKQVLSNEEQPSPKMILCLASYKPLNEYEWSGSLLVTNEIQEVFTRQVTEPKQEATFKSDLPVLEDISDKVSSKVRDQYEVSPYPRWVNLGLPSEPAPIPRVVNAMKLKLFDDKINKVGLPNILVAGCGTGQHSIETAARFKDSKVLAIDLSLSSLAYAKRKTEELGIQNIEYMQADILDLGKLDRQFDIVESTGVLHHMDDPIAGWRALTDCLRPGGLMKIGLYSELARQHIVEMRREISKAGIGSSDLAMKSFRNSVINSDQNHHKKIQVFSDFYSLSELKDLLFHVQEHRFTIPQIQACLTELGLKFCGFEAEHIVQNFKLTNTEVGGLYDLDKWQTYEKDNQKAFGGMYQFWCQKIA